MYELHSGPNWDEKAEEKMAYQELASNSRAMLAGGETGKGKRMRGCIVT